MAEIQVYPVGWLEAIRHRQLRREWAYMVRQVRAHNWRQVRNTFNGYLAEMDSHPHGCGHGWTKRAATRRVLSICDRTCVLDPKPAAVEPTEQTWSMSFVADKVPDDVWTALFGDEPVRYSMTVKIPGKRRTVWEWLTRKPRHLAQTIYIPNARVTEERGPRR